MGRKTLNSISLGPGLLGLNEDKTREAYHVRLAAHLRFGNFVARPLLVAWCNAKPLRRESCRWEGGKRSLIIFARKAAFWPPKMDVIFFSVIASPRWPPPQKRRKEWFIRKFIMFMNPWRFPIIPKEGISNGRAMPFPPMVVCIQRVDRVSTLWTSNGTPKILVKLGPNFLVGEKGMGVVAKDFGWWKGISTYGLFTRDFTGRFTASGCCRWHGDQVGKLWGRSGSWG